MDGPPRYQRRSRSSGIHPEGDQAFTDRQRSEQAFAELAAGVQAFAGAEAGE
jgi:hypothetical protein